jgi:hypothetical protein
VSYVSSISRLDDFAQLETPLRAQNRFGCPERSAAKFTSVGSA